MTSKYIRLWSCEQCKQIRNTCLTKVNKRTYTPCIVSSVVLTLASTTPKTWSTNHIAVYHYAVPRLACSTNHIAMYHYVCSTETNLVSQSSYCVPLGSTGTNHDTWHWLYLVLTTLSFDEKKQNKTKQQNKTKKKKQKIWQSLVAQPWSKTYIVHCTFDVHVSIVTVKAVVHLWAAVSLPFVSAGVLRILTCCVFSH